MMSCYEFFSYYDIQGILKLDDDVSLSPDHAEDVLYPANFQYDYIGAELYWLVSGSYPITKSSNERFTLAIGDETLYFFAGPFYWVSRAAILKIVESGVRVPWEDVNVGYALSQWNECRVAKPYWFRMGAVRWEC
jgi:hypothetical protein